MKKQVTIQRYSAPERINHWVTAFCFMLAAISGLGFFFPSFNWLLWHRTVVSVRWLHTSGKRTRPLRTDTYKHFNPTLQLPRATCGH